MTLVASLLSACSPVKFGAGRGRGVQDIDSPEKRLVYMSDMLDEICVELGPRPVGSKDYMKSAEIIRREFARACPVAELDYFTFDRWVLKNSPLLSVGGRSLENYPSHGTSGTPSEGISGILLKTPDDQTQYSIIDAESSALLGYIAAKYDLAVPLPYYSYDMEVGCPPVFNVGKNDIPLLDTAARDKSPVIAKSHVEFIPNVRTANVFATIPGESDEEILVIGHLDTVYNTVGANDNTASVIIMLMLAHDLFGVKPKRTVTFLATDGEEYNKLGAINYADRRKREGTSGRIKYLINFDSLTWGNDLQISSRDKDLRELVGAIDSDLGTAGTAKLIDGDGFALDGRPFRSPKIRAMYVNSRGYDTVNVWHRPEDTPDSVPMDTIETGFPVFRECIKRMMTL